MCLSHIWTFFILRGLDMSASLANRDMVTMVGFIAYRPLVEGISPSFFLFLSKTLQQWSWSSTAKLTISSLLIKIRVTPNFGA